jgi:inward rectifier potassium channel
MSVLRKAINRMRPGEDIGLDYSGAKGRQRTINEDGSYNMVRKTGRLFGNFYLYHWLITTSWKNFWLFALAYYSIMNVIFAAIYFWVGPQTLGGMQGDDAFTQFLYCFFFSAQSFTTVGYGGLHPLGKLTNVVATLEAFVGVMTFAIATGTLYARFAKPVSRIKYSKNIIIAPYNDITGMQFMVANEMRSGLMEMEARVNISWQEDEGNGKMIRRFQQVKLQLDRIAMFPTSWTINHPIDEESGLYGLSIEKIREMDFEIFVLLKGFDDVFSQTIYSRHSYAASQFVYGAKFRRPFGIDSSGKSFMDLTKVGDFDLVELPAPQYTG